jgi:hypothetical protein
VEFTLKYKARRRRDMAMIQAAGVGREFDDHIHLFDLGFLFYFPPELTHLRFYYRALETIGTGARSQFDSVAKGEGLEIPFPHALPSPTSHRLFAQRCRLPRRFPKLDRRLQHAKLSQRRDRTSKSGFAYDLSVLVGVKRYPAYDRLFPRRRDTEKLADMPTAPHPLNYPMLRVVGVAQNIKDVRPRRAGGISVLEDLEGATQFFFVGDLLAEQQVLEQKRISVQLHHFCPHSRQKLESTYAPAQNS